jgi:Ca2+/Na+ antiporter
MDINADFFLKATMAVSLIIMVVMALVTYFKPSQKGIFSVVTCAGIFFVVWSIIDPPQNLTSAVGTIVFVAWALILIFYFFSNRVFDKEPSGDSIGHSENMSQRQKSLLQLLRRVLFWPMMLLLLWIVLKGLSGKGWVTSF